MAGAEAACSSHTPATGQTVTCTGADAVAVTPAVGTANVTVNLLSGASITGTGVPAGVGFTNFASVYVFDNGAVTNAGTIAPNTTQSTAVGVALSGSTASLVNNGMITVANPTTTSKTLYGVISTAPDGSEFSDVRVRNNGTISVTQNANQTARAVYSGENIDSMTINNFGTISLTKVGNPTGTRAAAAIDSDDDTDTLVVHNRAGATITATGGNTFAVGGRAGDYTLTNAGTITDTGTLTNVRNTSLATVPTTTTTSVTGGAALLIYGPGDATVTNRAKGVINGDVWLTDLSPIAPNAGQGGQDYTRDSTFTNVGTVNGAFHYGNGTHELDNSGTITGNIAVDQTVPISAGNATTTTGRINSGGAAFTLMNSGTLGGNIRIIDRADSVNVIALSGTGFDGSVAAVNGVGSNTLRLDGVTSLQSVKNFSTLNFMSSNVTVANGVSLVDGATIRTTIFGPGGTTATPSTNLGSMTGTLTLQGDTRIIPVFATTVTNGSVYQLASQVASAGTITVRKTTLVTLTPDTSSGALNLRATVRSAATAAPGISRPGAQTIDALTSYTGSNPQVQALGGIVDGLRSAADVAAAGQALSPTVNGADVQVPINSAMLFHQQIDARLDTFIYSQIPASGRSADLGVARPTPVYGVVPPNGAWAEGIGGDVHQSTVAGVTGYNADLAGIMGGYDRLIAPTIRVGAAFGYIDGTVNSNLNLSGTRESIQTYQGLVYAAYEGPRAYLRGSFGYGGVDFKSQRDIAFNGFNDTAYGRHNGNILTARGEGGVPIEVHDNLFVPYAAFTYSRLDQDAYQEQSAAGAAFAYGSATNDSDRSEVGGKAIIPIGMLPMFATIFPVGSAAAIEGRAAYVHEFGNVAQQVSASFAGGNSFLVTGPTPNRDMLDYSVGLRVGSGPVQVDLSYNALARSSYYQQVGLLRARVLF